MKRKKAIELFNKASMILICTTDNSKATNAETGEVSEIHRIAHGAGNALAAAALVLEGGLEPSDAVAFAKSIIMTTLDWEKLNPGLMGEGGGGDE